MGLRVVKTHRQSLDMCMFVRAFDLHFFYFRAAVQDLPTDRGPVEFHPFCGTNQPPFQSFQMEFPRANEEVKIVLPISFVGRGLLSTTRTILCRHSFRWKNKQRTEQTKSEQGFT